MTKRLYVREITYRAYIYIDMDSESARKYDRQIVADSMRPDKECLRPVEPGANPLSWPKGSLVYHNDKHDLSLEDFSMAGEVEAGE